LAAGLWHTATFSFSYDFMQDTAARYNQGWIVSRVMTFVRSSSRMHVAKQSRMLRGRRSCREFLDPDKPQAGGRENMRAYAGVELSEGTSMNLGYAGEMYANFGHWGGVIGCAAYACFSAAYFASSAGARLPGPCGGALVPYVFFSSLKAEDVSLRSLHGR
jgi:hypothetical protein